MDRIIEGKFQGIVRRISGYVVSAFALLTIIPILVFCLLFVRVYLSDDLRPYDILGLLLIAFLGILIAFLGFVWLKSKVHATLMDLRSGLDEIARLDPEQEELMWEGGEIGRLAAALNRIVAHLRKEKGELARKNAELAKRAGKHAAAAGRLALVLESVGEGVFMTDAGRSITYVNPAGCSLLGYEKDEMIGRPSADFFGGEAGRTGASGCGMWDAGCETAWEGEILKRRKDGVMMPIHLRTFCLFGEGGEPLGRVGIARDISIPRAFREQRLGDERLASISSLIAGFAHELNNPLTGIVGYCEILMETVLDERLKDDLRKIHAEARRCDRIVRKLKAFGRAAGLKEEPLDLNGILREAAELKLHRIEEGGVDLELDLEPGLPPLRGDGDRLQLALVSVIDNSLRALSGREKKRLAIRSSTGGDGAVIKIIDSGCGIPEDTVSRVFDPFFSGWEPDAGAGLGLSIAREAVGSHGGTMEIESSPGRGTTLTITLPLEKPA